MHLHSVATRPGTVSSIKQHHIAAICGLTLAVAGVAGAGAWRAAEQGGTSKTATTAAHVAFPNRPATDPIAVDFATQPVMAAALGRQAGASTYYLVASQEQANIVKSSLNEANAVRAQVGEVGLTSLVVIGPSAEAEAGLRDTSSMTNLLRQAAGLSFGQVVDLRTSSP
ncbi:MAG: hypothetical protein ACR2PL_25770 [Dehalococcoidia bacterium]